MTFSRSRHFPEIAQASFLCSIPTRQAFLADRTTLPPTPYTRSISISRYLDIDVDLIININIPQMPYSISISRSIYLDIDVDLIININIPLKPYSIPISISKNLDIVKYLVKIKNLDIVKILSRLCQYQDILPWYLDILGKIVETIVVRYNKTSHFKLLLDGQPWPSGWWVQHLGLPGVHIVSIIWRLGLNY